MCILPSLAYEPVKRVFDLVVAGTALVVLSLPLAVTAVLIVWLIPGGGPFFLQERPGRYLLPFKVVKFRTMIPEVAVGGAALPDHERTPRFGFLLRRLGVDELPQLINVVRGEMSLVGPRPLLMRYVGRYPERYACRHDVLPGITGWAQVHGRRLLTFSQRFEHDVWYVNHRSFALDMRILWMTVLLLLQRPSFAPIDQAVTEVDDLGLFEQKATDPRLEVREDARA